MDPIQRALDLRQAGLNCSVFWKDSVADALDDTMELAVRMSHQENVDRRADLDMFELGLAIISDHIPNGGVDECEHRPTRTRISTQGNVHVRHVGVKRSDDPATLKVKARLVDS